MKAVGLIMQVTIGIHTKFHTHNIVSSKELETIASYLQSNDEEVNTIKGIGEDIEERVIVQKVLRNLPIRFNPKVCSIEKMRDLNKMTMDILHGNIIQYDMRIENPNPKEVTFKLTKNKKESKNYLPCSS